MPPAGPSPNFNPRQTSNEFIAQWTTPADVFSVLLLLGGDVVNRALAQLAGNGVNPVAFSFGWVAYAINAIAVAVGENRLMPLSDCACKVINARSGYVRDNTSWVIGRILRDFDSWRDPRIRDTVDKMLEQKWNQLRVAAERKSPGSGAQVRKPTQAGLCVSFYRGVGANIGYQGRDLVYYSGFVVAIIQLGVAAIPFGVLGDWSGLLVTACGIVLSFATGSLPQWTKEKWSCRENTATKNIILTRGNGSQHALVILDDGKGFDLEDLAAGPVNVDVHTSKGTRTAVVVLAAFWILLLITAAGIKENTWFLLAVGAIGMLQNIYVAGCARNPREFGVPLELADVITETKVMSTLYAVEEKYPGMGSSMLDTYFPGGNLRPEEKARWEQYEVARKS